MYNMMVSESIVQSQSAAVAENPDERRSIITIIPDTNRKKICEDVNMIADTEPKRAQ